MCLILNYLLNEIKIIKLTCIGSVIIIWMMGTFVNEICVQIDCLAILYNNITINVSFWI